jgi:hypothetical protein
MDMGSDFLYRSEPRARSGFPQEGRPTAIQNADQGRKIPLKLGKKQKAAQPYKTV